MERRKARFRCVVAVFATLVASDADANKSKLFAIVLSLWFVIGALAVVLTEL